MGYKDLSCCDIVEVSFLNVTEDVDPTAVDLSAIMALVTADS